MTSLVMFSNIFILFVTVAYPKPTKLFGPCANDIVKLCGEKNRVGLLQQADCLIPNQNKLSAVCKNSEQFRHLSAAYQDEKAEEKSSKTIPPRSAEQKVCDADAAKYCKDAASVSPHYLNLCIEYNKDKLTEECRKSLFP